MPSVEIFKHDPGATTIAAGEALFAEGDSGDVMYVVLEGSIGLTRHGAHLDTLEPGGIFGEMALVDHRTRSATATAETDAVVVPVDKKRFLYLVQNTPYFALEVMQTMCERLRRQNDLG